MADDLEAFLRQAAQRRAQQRRAAPPAIPPGPPSPPKASTRPTAPPRAAPLATTPTPSPPPAPTERVGTRVSTAEFAQRARHLGEEVSQAHELLQPHLAETFDERISSSEFGGWDALDPPAADHPVDVAELIAMLRDPSRVPYAIILSEVLAPRFRD